jgi:recombinational DNA repair protein (RecF pathway)
MHEYVTKAVVLDKATRGGEADARYSFFTERYGKVTAKATSSRKIISKLAGHLEPGTLVAVRIIEQHGTKVVDALKITRVQIGMRSLAALNELLGEWEPDAEMWHELVAVVPSATEPKGTMLGKATFSWARALAILGWDPREAVCANCGRGVASVASAGGDSASGNSRATASSPAQHARYFSIPRQEFFCAACAAPLSAALRYNKSIRNHLILVS